VGGVARPRLRRLRDPGVLPVPHGHRHPTRPVRDQPVDRARADAGEVAEFVIDGLDKDTFLILPNPAVGGSFRKKAADYDAWIARTIARLARISGYSG
jgi:hypothetical protein